MMKRASTRFVVLLLTTVLQPFGHAQEDFWEQTNGPYGGELRSVTTNSRGYIFVGTNGRGMFGSTDHGLTWVSLGLVGPEIHCILVDDSDKIFVGTNVGGIYRSSDDGISWIQVNSGLTVYDIWALGENDHGMLFAGSWSGGAFRSSDNGDNWKPVNTGMPALPFIVWSLETADSGIVFAGTNGNGLYRSLDDGESWEAVGSTLPNRWIMSLAKDAQGYVYAGTYAGPIYRTTDNGLTWTPLLTSPSYIPSLAVGNDHSIYAGQQFGYGIYRSTDHGLTWLQVNNNLENCAVLSVWTSYDNRVFAATSPGGLYQSTDNGSTWEKIGLPISAVYSLVRSTGGGMIAGTRYGIYLTSDHGNTWIDRNNGLIKSRVSALAVNSFGHIFAASLYGQWHLHRSTDDGVTWTPLSLGDGTLTYTTITAGYDSVVFIGTETMGLHRSTNCGNDWSRVDSGFSSPRINSTVVNSLGHVFTATEYGIYRSTDDGRHWTTIHNGLGETRGRILGVDVNDNLFLNTSDLYSIYRVYRSTDNGDSWMPVGLNSRIYSFASTDSGQIVASSRDGFVYYSIDQGIHWTTTRISDGSNDDIWSVQSDGDGYIYAGSANFGVLRTNHFTTGIGEGDRGLPTISALAQNYPNPFNPGTRIEFTLRQQDFVDLKVFDILGREVATLVSEIKPPGLHVVHWNGGDAPSGIYFYQIKLYSFIETKKLIILR